MTETKVTVQTIINLLTGLLKEEGSLLLATIPGKLKPIEYKEFSGGKGLKAWLTTFPEFELSSDGLYLFLAGTPHPEAKPADNADTELSAETRGMYKFSYMNYWNQNLRRLRMLGDFADVKADQFRDQVARALMHSLFSGALEITVSDQAPQLILNTGYVLESGCPVYAVFCINPLNEDGRKPFWLMKGFCTTAEEDTSELADWVRAYFRGRTTYSYSNLNEQIEKIDREMQQLQEETEAFRTTLAAGKCPALEGEDRYSDRILAYEGLWERLRQMVKSIPGLSVSETFTLSDLQQLTSRESLRADLLRQVLDAFAQLSSGMHEFLAQNRWVSGAESSALKDMQQLRQLCQQNTGTDSVLQKARELLEIYRCFRSVVSTGEIDDAYYEKVDQLRTHFTELNKMSLRTAANLLFNIPEEDRPFLNELEGVAVLLDRYAASEAEKLSGESSLPKTNGELLTAALNAEDAYRIRWPRYVSAALPEDPALCDKILQAPLTCCDAANRLLAAGETALAERYLILGLLHEAEACVPDLLQLYKQTGKEEAFEAVWRKHHTSLLDGQEDDLVQFSLVCDRSPEEALTVVKERIHLQYQPEYLEKLIPAAHAVGQTDLEEVFRRRLEKINACPEQDELENAIVAGDWAAVAELTEPEQLGRLGLETRYVQRVRSAVESGDYPKGSSDYEIGVRLYKFLGNRNGRAEKYLWNGLPERGSSKCVELLLLLVEEQRWEEAIALYETNRESQMQFEDCRRLYLIARYSRSPEDAQVVFTENLQDVLTIMTLKPSMVEKFRKVAVETNNEFYDRLLKLHEAVSSPYLWSVVCEDRSLRERVNDQAQLAELGLDVTVIGEIYRGSRYSHGRDAMAVAERLYALAGNLSAAAELTAILAGTQSGAAQLLWKIYTDERNEAALYTLLEENENLRREHDKLYLGFVYAREEYGRYLTLLAEQTTLSGEDRIRRATAEMLSDKPLTDTPEQCAQDARSCAVEDCKKLLSAAAAAHGEIVIAVVCACFEDWILNTPEQVKALIGCGAATAQLLEALQQQALARELPALAVYLQNVLGIGEIPQQAEQLYHSLQQEMQTETTEKKLMILRKLQYIFPEQSADIRTQMLTISVQQVLDSAETANKKEIASKLEEIILSLEKTPELLDVITRLLKDTEYCLDYRVYNAIYNYGKEVDCLPEALLFLHEAGKMEAAAQKTYFQENLTKLYYATLLADRFPAQIAAEAERLCLQVLRQTDSAQAALSVCMLELLQDRPIFAKAALNHWLTITDTAQDAPKDALRAVGVENDAALMEMVDSLPNSLELFEQVLNLGSNDALLDYLAFCRQFVKTDAGAWQELRNLRYGDALSEAQSVQAVELLCSDPEKAEYWNLCAWISFDVEDTGRAVFLDLCSAKNYIHWKEYVQLCETLTESPERLPAALAAWAAAPNAQQCREYLVDKLETQPDYLIRNCDSESLCRMTDALCRPLKDADWDVPHAQLGAVALIAVGTGDPECLKILQRDAGRFLFGSKSDLGVVVLSKLLLSDRIPEALSWLSNLKNSLAAGKYRTLIDELADLDEDALRAWRQVPSAERFLKLIPDDGNQPNIERIAKTTMFNLLAGKEKEMAEALMRLLRIFPDDYTASHELFELCKTGFEGAIPLMHFSLVNLCRVTVDAELAKDFDDRRQVAHMQALAILNQLLIWKGQTHLVSNWNFEQPTVQGLESCGVLVNDAAMLMELEQQVRDSLKPYRLTDQFQPRTEAWLATITGNWTEYLSNSFANKRNPAELYFPQAKVDDAGMTRSVLLLLLQAGENRLYLKQWLSRVMGACPNYKNQIKLALYQDNEGRLDRFAEVIELPAELILKFPADNSRLFRGLLQEKGLLRVVQSKGLSYAEPVAHILCAVGHNRWGMYNIFTLAEDFYKKGQDDLAWALYCALQKTSKALQLSHSHSARHMIVEKGTHSLQCNQEEYQAKMRICGCFIGQEQCVAKLGNPQLNPWTLINLILCMAVSRADEILRLEEYMDPARAAMAENVRLLLAPDVEDGVKLQVIQDETLDPLDRYYLAKMLGYPYSKLDTEDPYFLKDRSSVAVVSKVFYALKNGFSTKEKTNSLKPLLCKSVRNVSTKISAQIDPSNWEIVKSAPAEKNIYVYIPPKYVAQLTPIETDEDGLKALQQKYGELKYAATHESYHEKAELSQQIYRCTLGAKAGAEACYRALLRFSVDRFYDLISDGSQSAKEQAYRLLIELLGAGGETVDCGEDEKRLEELVNMVGVVGLFKTYTQIRALCEDYANNEKAFIKLKDLLRDYAVIQDMAILYEILKKLNNAISLFSSSDVTKVIEQLREADSSISAMGGVIGASVKGHLQRLIRTELSALSRRAILEIRLLNSGVQAHRGNLTGVVYNKGTIEATELTLQAFYEETSSPRFVLGRLLPNNKAIFEIPYDAPLTAELLRGKLDLSGKSGKTEVSDVQDFTLPLGETSGDDLPFIAYSPESPGFFVFDPQTQTVKNGQFFGRSTETARMRELVSGGRFEEFRSAVVYGVRRTGKTALLDYFKTYVSGMYPDCLCFRVDVQLSEVTIHSVFVDSVLKKTEVLKALETCSDRDIFLEKWAAQKVTNGEMDPRLIREFFRELKELTGKGVVLIIDEIDRLFKKITDEHGQTVLNDLLRTISGLLDDEERRSFLQLVICGSNWLMHYNDVGHDMQQMFHRFGDKIAVGNLPPVDVNALLDSANVNYAPGTKELIGEYTSGLVWFVKLLANEAIRRAKDAKRNRIYPADVVASLSKVVSEQNCKQFYEGCEVGSEERVMIDAIQSLAYRKDAYVHVEQIGTLMGKGPEEVGNILRKLLLFEIVERNQANPSQVRFRMDIYRRFFRSTHSAFPVIPGETDMFEIEAASDAAAAAPVPAAGEQTPATPVPAPAAGDQTPVYRPEDEL